MIYVEIIKQNEGEYKCINVSTWQKVLIDKAEVFHDERLFHCHKSNLAVLNTRLKQSKLKI